MQNSEEEVRRRVEEIYDLIKDIRDPEKPQTLEELGVVTEDDIRVDVQEHYSRVSVTLVPTVPHCHLAAIIGEWLCVRARLERDLPYTFKLDIFIKEGSHTTAAERKSPSCYNHLQCTKLFFFFFWPLDFFGNKFWKLH
ncbi:unnamed protein product [Ixodes persulcatus]